ncbi:MAG: GGDEF domain-containing protein [Xanthomonadales bacterium]|nr:GGDEF domain-containing protein [Xanthomonadales bacterium]
MHAEVVGSFLLDAAGRPYALLGISRDVSERRRAENELRAANEQLRRQLVEIEQLQVALKEQTIRDSLTGCFNRRYLTLFELQQSDPGWAALVIDLDQFKRINDAHGHERGDQVLRDFASFLRQHLPADGALVRSGGDEFILLLSTPEALPAKQLMQQLERHRDDASCAFSVGLALRQGRESLISTIARADRSMYGSKDQRRQG